MRVRQPYCDQPSHCNRIVLSRSDVGKCPRGSGFSLLFDEFRHSISCTGWKSGAVTSSKWYASSIVRTTRSSGRVSSVRI